MRINILKFHKFMKTVVNPASVVSLIESLDSVLIEDVRLTTDAFKSKKSQSVMQRRSRSIQSLQIPNKISKSNARNAIATLPKVQQNAYNSNSHIE